MDLADLINPEDIRIPFKTSCKKQLLSDLADIAAKKTGLKSQEIFQTLLEREKLGSTGIGNGIAIPHGKFDDLKKIVGLVAVLENPIEFDSLDDEPVDIVVMLLAPEMSGADHLKALARIARALRQPEMLSKLRNATDAQSVYHILTASHASHAA